MSTTRWCFPPPPPLIILLLFRFFVETTMRRVWTGRRSSPQRAQSQWISDLWVEERRRMWKTTMWSEDDGYEEIIHWRRRKAIRMVIGWMEDVDTVLPGGGSPLIPIHGTHLTVSFPYRCPLPPWVSEDTPPHWEPVIYLEMARAYNQ